MSKGKVLIVEDEKSLRDVYEIILKNVGYEVETAINGLEALERVEAQNPDFVLLDIFMPVMSGLDFMRHINLDDYPHMKVIVFSNNSDSGVKEEICRLGARDVILKSDVSPSSLVALVEEAFAA